jgi:hypothetical protein
MNKNEIFTSQNPYFLSKVKKEDGKLLSTSKVRSSSPKNWIIIQKKNILVT